MAEMHERKAPRSGKRSGRMAQRDAGVGEGWQVRGAGGSREEQAAATATIASPVVAVSWGPAGAFTRAAAVATAARRAGGPRAG